MTVAFNAEKDENSRLLLRYNRAQSAGIEARIAMYEKRTQGADGSLATLVRYIYSNHLSTATLELDDTAAIISYEEYHPYGTTAYYAKNSAINAVAKRYKYTGKERDEETGLYYHGARYYIPWLCRWAAVDPKQGEMATWSPYNYGFCNPVIYNDPTGLQPDDPQTAYQQGEKRTQAGFQAKLNEIQNSKADAGFKRWAGAVGLSGVVDLRNQLFESKIHSYQTAPGARAMYGFDPQAEGNGVLVPESIRQRLWTEANNEAIPTLKATWAALQSGGATSGMQFTYNLNLTISNREEGWSAIKSAGIKVGLQWALHLAGGGASNLAKTADAAIPKVTLYRGINETHPGFEVAKQGSVIPRGGNATPLEHNTVTTESQYTSWTTNRDVAVNFALRPTKSGIVLEKSVSVFNTVKSPNVYNITLMQSKQVVSESEVLLKGVIKNFKITPIHMP